MAPTILNEPHTITVARFDNITDPRYGRHVVHDSRSLRFLSGGAKPVKPTKAVLHKCHVDPWDQGQIGDCTMNAACGLLVTEPYWTPATPKFTERMIVPLYSEETRLDDVEIPGVYPPDDTGSSGLYSMKVLQRHGWITNYETAQGLTAALATLAVRPISIGVGYYDSMESPDSSGRVTISKNAQIVGGHQIAVIGEDPADHGWIRIRQSWGTGFGDKGYIMLSWSDFDRLLHEQGDVISPKLAAV